MIKVRRTIKSICAITLALMIILLLYPANLDVYAAGQLHVTLVGMDGVGEDFPGFTFELYKVGTLSRETHELDSQFADLDVKIPAAEDFDQSKEDGGADWQETWMDSAAALANHIKHPVEGDSNFSPIETFSGITPGETITYDATRDDLYLLIGSTVEYDNVYYTPLPMFLWNVDAQGIETVIKITSKTKVLKHSLMKIWDDNDNKAGVRPKAIEVGLYFGDELIDRIKLGGENGDWTYTWESEETGSEGCYIGKKDGEEIRKGFVIGDVSGWGVREFTQADQIEDSEAKAEASNMKYYSPEYEITTSDSLEAFIITNPYVEEEKPEEPPTPVEPEEPKGEVTPSEPEKPETVEPEKPSEPEKAEPTTPESKSKKVKTGDEFRPVLTIGVIAVAAILLIALLIRRRRNRE